MDPTTILYALSTMAQTCAALAALVGALGLYRLQSISARRQKLESALRGFLAQSERLSGDVAMLISTDQLSEKARDLLDHARPGDEERLVPRLRETLKKWDECDPDQRRTSRLLGFFVGWNLFAIGVSLAGFAFVHQLAWSPIVSTGGLWFLTIGTVLATGIMLVEMRDAFVRWFGHISWLEDG